MQWIKNIICSICLLEALLHIVPDSVYRKYVNFYAGLLILLMVLKPIISVFSFDESFDKLVQVQELKRELAELNMTWTGMEELGTQKVEEAWKRVEIHLERDEEERILDLSLDIQAAPLYPSKENEEEKKEELMKMIEEIYKIDRNKIRIVMQE